MIHRVRLGAWPVAFSLVVVAAVTLLVVLIAAFSTWLPVLGVTAVWPAWLVADLVHLPQFAVGFAVICWLTRGRPGEYGLNLRQRSPQFTHWRMFGVGTLAGILMSLQYLRQIAQGMALDIPRPVTTCSILGNMTFQWIVVGLSEEILFRGLIQTHLMKHLEGQVEILGHSLHTGTVIGALFWGIFHLVNILVMPLGPVVFVVVLTTVAGLAMGYAYQQTGSVLTTMIVHNTMFGFCLTVGYLLHWLLE